MKKTAIKFLLMTNRKSKVLLGSVIIVVFISLIIFILVNPGCKKDVRASAIPETETTLIPPKVVQNTYKIGDSFEGGIIFYIDGTGQHGLIAAVRDQGVSRWGNGEYNTTGARGTAVGTGLANTNQIIDVQGQEVSYAARLCANYSYGGFTGWFLPSRDELYLLYLKKSLIGGFTRAYYWSSSEFDRNLVWAKFFYNNDYVCATKEHLNGVRAIRTF